MTTNELEPISPIEAKDLYLEARKQEVSQSTLVMRRHSSQAHDEPVGHREVEPESLAVGDEDAPEPVRGLR